MNKALIAFSVFALVALFGCIQPGIATGASSFDKTTVFTAFTNNSTSDSFSLNTVLTGHAYSYNFTGVGGWNNSAVNVSFQGSIDNAQWKELSSVKTNVSGLSFVVDAPISYVRIVASAWNATAGNATAATLTVRYAGTG